MEIETYECETVPSADFTEEAIALAERLGATGQEAFYRKDKPVQPYRLMTPEEHAVYKLAFPIREEISKYETGPIPIRVLQVAAHAKELIEGTLVIWHQGAGKDDPLLTLRQGSEWGGKYFLLARWGDALEEFAVLRNRAIQRFALTAKAKLLACKQEIESALLNVDMKAEAAINAGKTDEPNFYWHI